jgi:hypothetical protein
MTALVEFWRLFISVSSINLFAAADHFADHKAGNKAASVSGPLWLLFQAGHHQALPGLTGMFIWAGP